MVATAAAAAVALILVDASKGASARARAKMRPLFSETRLALAPKGARRVDAQLVLSADAHLLTIRADALVHVLALSTSALVSRSEVAGWTLAGVAAWSVLAHLPGRTAVGAQGALVHVLAGLPKVDLLVAGGAANGAPVAANGVGALLRGGAGRVLQALVQVLAPSLGGVVEETGAAAYRSTLAVDDALA